MTSKLATCFSVGFRPFFLGASLIAVLSMLIWMLLVVVGQTDWLIFSQLLPMHWHAHEMIYGYAIAVVAGFLLTAVSHWTGLPTAENRLLAILFFSWVAARIFMLTGPITLAASFDIVFMLQLVYHIVKPIVKVRQWRQLLVVLVLVSLLLGNLFFYLGLLGIYHSGISIGIYLGFYLIIGMILLIGRRIIPSFINSGIESKTIFPELLIIDAGIAVGYVVFVLNQVILHIWILGVASSAILFLFCSLRILSWHHRAIWDKPLLWSLYVSYGSIAVGFLLYSISYLNLLSPYIALHLLAIAGVAFISLSMMSRVSLGHTGRNIHNPPPLLAMSFYLLSLAALIRVMGPVILSGSYSALIFISQICWIAAFSLFAYIYLPILIGPRADELHSLDSK